ncbi:MAG: hypothetical protein K2N16_01025, partial [Muribaculaceae bacterium]|nr:hypothetical protein [Muribaculaceae bacterium]
SGTLPLSEMQEPQGRSGTLPLSEIETPKPKSGTLPLSEMPKQPEGDKKKKSGALMWVLIAVGALVVIGGGVGGWLAYNYQQAKEAEQEQMATELAVNERYNELKFQCEQDIKYGDKLVWKPLVSAQMLLDSLKRYTKEYSDFEYYPLNNSELATMEENLAHKRAEAKAAWMKSANSQYEKAKDYSDAIERWHIAALLGPDADVKDIAAKFDKEMRCPAAYMAVYKASASGGKLRLEYYGLSDKPVKGVAINYTLDGHSGKAIVNIEPGFNTATIDVTSTASRGQLDLTCNGIMFYNQQLDN